MSAGNDPIRVEIRRSSWRRGTGEGDLVNNDDTCCVMGFVGLALGLTKAQMRDEPYLSYVPECDDISCAAKLLAQEDVIAECNDRVAGALTEREREKELKELLAACGFHLVFKP